MVRKWAENNPLLYDSNSEFSFSLENGKTITLKGGWYHKALVDGAEAKTNMSHKPEDIIGIVGPYNSPAECTKSFEMMHGIPSQEDEETLEEYEDDLEEW